MNTRQNDPHAETVVLPKDELAARRHRKLAPPALSVRQLHRLLAANELRKRAEKDD